MTHHNSFLIQRKLRSTENSEENEKSLTNRRMMTHQWQKLSLCINRKKETWMHLDVGVRKHYFKATEDYDVIAYDGISV